MFALTSNSPSDGLTTFQGLIIKEMGFTTPCTTLIQMPSGAVQFVACVAATVATKFLDMRLTMMLACLCPFLAGIIGLREFKAFSYATYLSAFLRISC
jgi:ACS family allantoate permease-like MFS transporter